MKAKTIITYLVDWDPNGIKTVELSNRVGKAIVIPRAALKNAKNRKETNQPAIYFLFWKDNHDTDLAYVGEAENLINRITSHETNKDFREVAIAFISKDNNLTKADVKFLEAKIIEKAKQAERYELTNSATPVTNNLPEYQMSVMEDFLDEVSLIVSTLWYPILKEIKRFQQQKQQVYTTKWPSADWKWIYTNEWFIVLKWSIARKKHTDTFWGNYVQLQKKLISTWVLKEINVESFEFTRDCLFKTPTAAANMVLTRQSNWRVERKDKNGKTLDEVERKSLETK